MLQKAEKPTSYHSYDYGEKYDFSIYSYGKK